MKQDINVFSNFCVFRTIAIGNQRWPPLSLIGWDISTSSLQTLNGIKRSLKGSSISKFATKFAGFLLGWSENKDGHPILWLLRHFPLLLCNRWTTFNESGQETKFQRSLPNYVFLADLKTKTAALDETFSTSVLNQLNVQKGRRGFKPRIRPPCPQRVVKGD